MIRRSSVANTSIESNIRSESHVLLPELLSVEEAFLRACLNGLFAPRFHLCRLEITGVRLAGRIGAEMWTEAHWTRHKAAPKKISIDLRGQKDGAVGGASRPTAERTSNARVARC